MKHEQNRYLDKHAFVFVPPLQHPEAFNRVSVQMNHPVKLNLAPFCKPLSVGYKLRGIGMMNDEYIVILFDSSFIIHH